ncbi:protein translocase subunit SecD [Patescibacteria group bacterium]|nr:protein translocase subunit SecD [Patescibacteria group bacterium]
MKKTSLKRFLVIMALFMMASWIALPEKLPVKFNVFGQSIDVTLSSPVIDLYILGKPVHQQFEFKQGLDIQGGMQIVLEADMSQIAEADRAQALESVREVILRRVDLYGISEPVVQASSNNDQYRLMVELAGVSDSTQALSLIGQTAQLDFKLIQTLPPENEVPSEASADNPEAEVPAQDTMQLIDTGLSGAQLKRAQPALNPQTNEPEVSLQFDEEGAKLFGDLTTQHEGEMLGIFLDQVLLMAPSIKQPILTGQAVITGQFTLEEVKQLSIQLNAGALPVPIRVLEQRTIGASLGNESVRLSIRAGLIGLGLVVIFMILVYDLRGVLASWALLMYAVFTVAIYKILGVTLTLPGIAGLILSIGMAVDANILIFERMKEELRAGKSWGVAMELGFGRAWDSIKDANVTTILTALVLINPLGFSFLNTSGLVRGFGITLLIGVVLGLVTGVVITRTLVRLFLREKQFVVMKTGGSNTPHLN